MINNKTIVIMGGGTAGWISALYFLNKSFQLNLNLKIKLVSSNDIETIGVGEGTTPYFTTFIEGVCGIDKKIFLRETKGSFKLAVKFDNWNFDGDYYYHGFSDALKYKDPKSSVGNRYIYADFARYAIDNDYNISQKDLQRIVHGEVFDLYENNSIALNMMPGYAYHFSANLIIPFLKKECSKFENFNHITKTIQNANLNDTGYVRSITVDGGEKINGDFFINCLGFKSENILGKEYFDNEYWDKYILNNSAFAIQVKNPSLYTIEPYTTSTAQEYGWSWKIPQYEKTGYGYVYSDHFTDDTDKLYEDILKTYKINEKDVFKTKIVKSKPYFNRKQIHKNCLSVGLSSGFVEPLEATSIHLTLQSLNKFFEMVENKIEFNEKYLNVYNRIMRRNWRNVFKFIIFHYFTNNPINDYWKHYKNIQRDEIFEFYEKTNDYLGVFTKHSYDSVSLGMRIKEPIESFEKISFMRNNINDYLKTKSIINCTELCSHNEVLNEINENNNIKYV